MMQLRKKKTARWLIFVSCIFILIYVSYRYYRTYNDNKRNTLIHQLGDKDSKVVFDAKKQLSDMIQSRFTDIVLIDMLMSIAIDKDVRFEQRKASYEILASTWDWDILIAIWKNINDGAFYYMVSEDIIERLKDFYSYEYYKHRETIPYHIDDQIKKLYIPFKGNSRTLIERYGTSIEMCESDYNSHSTASPSSSQYADKSPLILMIQCGSINNNSLRMHLWQFMLPLKYQPLNSSTPDYIVCIDDSENNRVRVDSKTYLPNSTGLRGMTIHRTRRYANYHIVNTVTKEIIAEDRVYGEVAKLYDTIEPEYEAGSGRKVQITERDELGPRIKWYTFYESLEKYLQIIDGNQQFP